MLWRIIEVVRISNGITLLSASDLVGHLSCRYLTGLDAAVARGELAAPRNWDPNLQVLRQRGATHEQRYVEHLAATGRQVVRIGGVGIDQAQVDETVAAMRSGAEIIVQGALSDGNWVGRADILRRVEGQSRLGSWHYEVIDTKLARETSGGTILQLCLYSDLLARLQGFQSEFMYVVAPWSKFEPERFRTHDFAAYYRLVRASLEAAVREQGAVGYPDPKEHCEICRWRWQCDARRRADDHPCLVAGISRLQITELAGRGVETTVALAEVALPLLWKPGRGAVETYVRVREQARVQVEGRSTGRPVHEVLDPRPGYGLTRLPEPSPGDIFFDIEGDPFVGDGGLEYLFGYLFFGKSGDQQYVGDWALSRDAERRAFECFIDFVAARRLEYPDLHIYHFAPYEPGALKRLMGRYATREEALDRMLRASLFVDLYAVVRQGIRAGVESYSIKQLEAFYGFQRSLGLPEANRALAAVQACLELADPESITGEHKAVIESYNRDDCASTDRLRNWLESLRDGLVGNGSAIERPAPAEGAPSETVGEWQQKIDRLAARLTADIPADVAGRDEKQQARWLLAGVLDWHRREDKAAWWEFYRLKELPAIELLDERSAISGLAFLAAVEVENCRSRTPVHRYGFPPQETQLRGGEELRCLGGDRFGKVNAISFEGLIVDIKKRKDSAEVHPAAVFAHDVIDTKVLARSLFELGEHVAEHGIAGDDGYEAARDLLMRLPPRVGSNPLRRLGETPLEAALRLAPNLEGGVLPVQGPPGAGKTFTGARLICELVARGAKVGITAASHKVIGNLLAEVIKAADERYMSVSCIQKIRESEEPEYVSPCITLTTDNKEFFNSLHSTYEIGAGTAWLWARPEARGALDVLFVDEAAQMSLANVLAISPAAKGLVLLGDPQQLEQPMQGSHPDGAGVSALDHILGGHKTIAVDRGLFLDETWRLHPDICRFTSELFYESKLKSKPGLEQQRVISSGPIAGSGLRYLPVTHDGNQSSSPEEADRVQMLVNGLVAGSCSWVNGKGEERAIGLDDILVIAPYNAQVFELRRRLPGARIGTVDKFQGQEAAVVIYTMTTSAPADAPHGMEFLYSLNRLNVATSRARCVCVLVGAPGLFEPECRTPRQMQLANALCRYREMAEEIRL